MAREARASPSKMGRGTANLGGEGVAAVTSVVAKKTNKACASHPSTTLRVVPLPIAHNGEEQ